MSVAGPILCLLDERRLESFLVRRGSFEYQWRCLCSNSPAGEESELPTIVGRGVPGLFDEIKLIPQSWFMPRLSHGKERMNKGAEERNKRGRERWEGPERIYHTIDLRDIYERECRALESFGCDFPSV